MIYNRLVGNQIRLLHVAKDIANPEDTSYSLTHVFLGDFPRYKALSYCWGDPHDLVLITVNGYQVKVTRSLHGALQMFRHEALDIEALWIDALCINQEDIEERNLQVLRMSSIYRQAEGVLAWLGPEPITGLNPIQQLFSSFRYTRDPEHSVETAIASSSGPYRHDRTQNHLAHPDLRVGNDGPDTEDQELLFYSQRQRNWLTYLSSLFSRNRRREYIPLQNYSDSRDEAPAIGEAVDDKARDFQRFAPLFSSPFWRRIWIVQEMTLAASILIVWGSEYIEWKTLSAIISDTFFKEPISSTSLKKPAFIDNPELETAYAGYSGYRTYRLFQLGNSRQRPLLLHEAMDRTHDFLSTDRLDMVYALLGITQDGPSLVPSPDYKISVEALQISITKAFVRRTLNLNIILMRGRNRNNGDNLPSWCPHWLDTLDSTAKYEKAYIYSSFGLGGDDIEFSEEMHRWRAGGRRLERWDASINANTVLYVKGYFFDIVEGLTSEYHHRDNRSRLYDASLRARQLWQPRKVTGNPYNTGLRSRLFSMKQSVPNAVVRALYARQHLEGCFENGVGEGLRRVRGFSGHFLERWFGTGRQVSPASEWLVENRKWRIHGKSLGVWFRQTPLWAMENMRTNILVVVVAGIVAAIVCATFGLLDKSSWSNFGLALVGCLVLVAVGSFLLAVAVLGKQMSLLPEVTKMVLNNIAAQLEDSRMRLIITQNGYIGLGHAQTRQDDCIFVIMGVTMPVVMRPYEDGFKVVGMAFVEGIMEGELLERPAHQLQELKLY